MILQCWGVGRSRIAALSVYWLTPAVSSISMAFCTLTGRAEAIIKAVDSGPQQLPVHVVPYQTHHIMISGSVRAVCRKDTP